jgi:hypothetical protein
LRDLQAAEAVGAQPMLVLTGKGEKTLRDGDFPEEHRDLPDLAFAVSALLAEEKVSRPGPVRRYALPALPALSRWSSHRSTRWTMVLLFWIPRIPMYKIAASWCRTNLMGLARSAASAGRSPGSRTSRPTRAPIRTS